MKRLSKDIIDFFHRQSFVIVTTVDRNGTPHNSCKGIVKINRNGTIYLLDLYRAKTYSNLRRNPSMSITAVDENTFSGYCLKGRSKEMRLEQLKPYVIRSWEERINSRITQRIIKSIRGEKGHPSQPEALLPKPAYMIVMDVKSVCDLTPHHIKLVN